MCYNGWDNKTLFATTRANLKPSLSSDCFLKFESMRSESLVIGDQHAPVNMFYSSVHTARHVLGVGMH